MAFLWECNKKRLSDGHSKLADASTSQSIGRDTGIARKSVRFIIRRRFARDAHDLFWSYRQSQLKALLSGVYHFMQSVLVKKGPTTGKLITMVTSNDQDMTLNLSLAMGGAQASTGFIATMRYGRWWWRMDHQHGLSLPALVTTPGRI